MPKPVINKINSENFIQRLKLSITTQCNLRCNYCFVNKSNKLVMPFSTAQNSVNLLLSVPRKEKRSLCVYGGEPLLYPVLARKIVKYAYLRSRRLRRRLAIVYCTNGILLNKSILDFFRRYGVFLNISLFARQRIHDQSRFDILGKGTFDRVIEKIFLAKRILPGNLLSVALCVSPAAARDIEKDVLFVTKELGIKQFSLEIIRRSVLLWTDDSAADFLEGIKNVLNRLIRGIAEGDFFFIDALSQELAVQHSNFLGNIREDVSLCPRRFCFEVYPDGGIAFSVFFHNSKDRLKHLLGNVNCFGNSKVSQCSFAANSKSCRDCMRLYFIGKGSLPREVLINRYYHALLIKTADLLKKYARKDNRFRQYIQKACERSY